MLIVPERLATACRGEPERCVWLELLPHAIRELQDRWSLSLGAPFDGTSGSCAWVAPAVRRDGSRAVPDLLEVDNERVRLWMFARAAAEPRDSWSDDKITLAKALS